MSLRRCESPGVIAQIAALSVDHAPTAIIGCPYTSRHDNAVRNQPFSHSAKRCRNGRCLGGPKRDAATSLLSRDLASIQRLRWNRAGGESDGGRLGQIHAVQFAPGRVQMRFHGAQG
jgi:hypothetical protein